MQWSNLKIEKEIISDDFTYDCVGRNKIEAILIDKFNDLIDDITIKLLSLKKLSFAKHLKSELEETENSIQMFREISAKLGSLQQKWLKDRLIFLDNDVDKYIPDQKENFKQIDSTMFEIGRLIDTDDSVFMISFFCLD